MRRVTRTSCQSTPSSSEHSVKFSETSAKPSGLRDSAPLKMTSAISPPRSDLADCSPKTQRTASQTLDFPQPFGPTMAVTPSWKLKIVLSAKDLNPKSSSDCRCIIAWACIQPPPRADKENKRYLEWPGLGRRTRYGAGAIASSRLPQNSRHAETRP